MNFLSVLEHLSQEGIEFVIVGGVAARLHGSHRLTHDLDLVPRLDESSWERLIDAIWELNVHPAKGLIRSGDARYYGVSLREVWG